MHQMHQLLSGKYDEYSNYEKNLIFNQNKEPVRSEPVHRRAAILATKNKI